MIRAARLRERPLVSAKGLANDMHSGCAFRSVEQARQWFSRGELRRLARLGYELVSIEADAIAYETPTQLVIQCERPLRQCVVKGGCVNINIRDENV